MSDERSFSRKFQTSSVVSSESVIYDIEHEFRKTGGAKNAGELWMERYGRYKKKEGESTDEHIQSDM